MKKKKKLFLRCLILLFISMISFYFGYHLFKKSLNNYSQEIIQYKENNTVDYKVYLKENDFFEVPYLGKDNIYITSLIDYLDIDFSNNIIFDKTVSGKYKYYVKALVSASKVDDDKSNFWQKEYPLTDVKEVKYTNQNIVFNTNVKVDYQKYNDILLEFKKQYNLSLDATLKIVLDVENVIDSDINAEGIEKKSYSILSIPLTKATIEVPIDVVTDNKTDALKSKLVYSESKKFLIYKIGAIILFIIAGINLIYMFLSITRKNRNKSLYNKKIDRILKEYDSIIVNLKVNIDLSELNVIDVNSFDELIDAHSEVRQPINFARHAEYSDFILINDKMAWRYRLVRDD